MLCTVLGRFASPGPGGDWAAELTASSSSRVVVGGGTGGRSYSPAQHLRHHAAGSPGMDVRPCRTCGAPTCRMQICCSRLPPQLHTRVVPVTTPHSQAHSRPRVGKRGRSSHRVRASEMRDWVGKLAPRICASLMAPWVPCSAWQGTVCH
jgi:hypothetical protein